MKKLCFGLLVSMGLFAWAAAHAGPPRYDYFMSIDTLRASGEPQFSGVFVPYSGASTTADANSTGRPREKALFPKARYGTNSAGSLKDGAFRGEWFRITLDDFSSTSAVQVDTISVCLFNRGQTDTLSKRWVFLRHTIGGASTNAIPPPFVFESPVGVQYDSLRVLSWGVLKNRLTVEMAGNGTQ